ncbi:MAG TPA: flagellar motor switch protein FliG [Rectinemataceae bacterium]|nr:flagellar motor switch protein FliG [Rectinemataceae bacterium]
MKMKDRLAKAYGTASDANGGERRPDADGRGGAPEHPRPETARSQPKRKVAPGHDRPSPTPSGPKALVAAESKAEGLLKSGSETGISRAAKFLLLLGTDEAAKVLVHLPPEDIERVSREILSIRKIDAIEANEVLAEFGWLVKTKGWALEGGPATAEKILSTAFGPERARELLRKASPESIRPFRFLNDFEPGELMVILKEESPQVLALILPYIEPKRASGLIELLQEPQRIEVVKRVARLEKVNPEVLRRVEETLKDRIRKIGTVSSDEIDGEAALAGILRHVDPRLEARVLEALEEESPEMSHNVRERLFTLEDVVRVPSRELQKALRDFQDRDLALVLKGRTDAFREKILGNVSKNRRELILDEYQILGAVRREDADEAARELLGYLKHAWDAGELVLEGEDELVE